MHTQSTCPFDLAHRDLAFMLHLPYALYFFAELGLLEAILVAG